MPPKQEPKPRIVIETGLDPRLLAALHRYYKSLGRPARSKAELLRTALNHLYQNLVQTELVDEPASVEEAIEYLESVGLGIAGRKGEKSLPLVIAAERERNDHPLIDPNELEDLFRIGGQDDSGKD